MTDVQQHLNRLLADLERVWPPGFVAVLFGSVARGEYIPGWSDINVLLIAPELAPETLRGSREALLRWRDAAGTLPLLFSTAEWHRSGDAYPLEIADMRTGYRVLRGTDPLTGLVVHPGDLRTALERELHGKLMRMRQGYALYGSLPTEMSEFLRRSASSVLVLYRGLLVLTGGPVPNDAAGVVAAAAAIAGFEPEPVTRIIIHRADPAWQCEEDDIRGYLAAVATAASFVDNFQTGART